MDKYIGFVFAVLRSEAPRAIERLQDVDVVLTLKEFCATGWRRKLPRVPAFGHALTFEVHAGAAYYALQYTDGQGEEWLAIACRYISAESAPKYGFLGDTNRLLYPKMRQLTHEDVKLQLRLAAQAPR